MGSPLSLCSQGPQATTTRQTIQYNGQQFVLPGSINFTKQSTFAQIELAARDFCAKNNISLFYLPLLTRIIAYRHTQLFETIWLDFKSTNQQEAFLEDLNNVEHDLMDSMYYHFVTNRRETMRIKDIKFQQPQVKEILSQADRQRYKKIGLRLIEQKKVAVVLMCAGSSSRFNSKKFQQKILSSFEINQKLCLLDLCLMRLKRNIGNASLAIMISCSEQNHQMISAYIKQKQFYEMQACDFQFIINSSISVLNLKGQYQLNSQRKLIKRSIGTAYSAEHIFNSPICQALQKAKVKYLYFGGTENLFENPCDPIFLGQMAQRNKRVGGKCTQSLYYQKWSRYYMNGQNASIGLLSTGDLQAVDLPKTMKLPIAMNSLIFQVQALKQILADFNKNMLIAKRYQVISKQQRVYNFTAHKIEYKQCYSFQKDLRYYLTCDKDPLLYQVERGKEYVPIITKNNQYSLVDAVTYFKGQLEGEINQMHQNF